MAFTSVTVSERKQGDSIGTITAEWTEGIGEDAVVYTYSETFDFSASENRTAFKANAIAYKDAQIAKKTKESNMETTILTFLNS